MGLMFGGHVRCLGRTGGGRLEEAIVDVCLLVAALLCQGVDHGSPKHLAVLWCLLPLEFHIETWCLLKKEKILKYLYF